MRSATVVAISLFHLLLARSAAEIEKHDAWQALKHFNVDVPSMKDPGANTSLQKHSFQRNAISITCGESTCRNASFANDSLCESQALHGMLGSNDECCKQVEASIACRGQHCFAAFLGTWLKDHPLRNLPTADAYIKTCANAHFPPRQAILAYMHGEVPDWATLDQDGVAKAVAEGGSVADEWVQKVATAGNDSPQGSGMAEFAGKLMQILFALLGMRGDGPKLKPECEERMPGKGCPEFGDGSICEPKARQGSLRPEDDCCVKIEKVMSCWGWECFSQFAGEWLQHEASHYAIADGYIRGCNNTKFPPRQAFGAYANGRTPNWTLLKRQGVAEVLANEHKAAEEWAQRVKKGMKALGLNVVSVGDASASPSGGTWFGIQLPLAVVLGVVMLIFTAVMLMARWRAQKASRRDRREMRVALVEPPETEMEAQSDNFQTVSYQAL